MTSDSQKLELVRFIFSTCILLNVFGQLVLNSQTKKQKSYYSRLCLDNIQDCVKKADDLIEDANIKSLLMIASGCNHTEVQMAT